MKVAITTLGCKVNQYDSAALATQLGGAGHTIQAFEPGADVYIVNTCSITDRADAESRQLARRIKRWNPDARIIMTGCYAQANPNGAAAVPEVDFVIGLDRRGELLQALNGDLAGNGRVFVSNLRKADGQPPLGAEIFGGRTRAFLKVQDGCDLFCTFCIVPWSRGRSRSVPPRALLAELDKLASLGFQEVVLTGIHLGGYGADLQPRIGLTDLVEMIAERAPVARVRLSSIDPPEISARLLDVMRHSDVLCHHLHMPVQAAEDGVLQRMRRRYDTRLVRDVVAEIRRQLPNAGLGTDVIAGFPAESEQEFDRSLALLEELSFTYFHVFPYSRRSGTTAAKLPGQLPKGLIAARAHKLRKLSDRKRAAFAAGTVGKMLRVLPEAGGKGGVLSGYARNYVRVVLPRQPVEPNREVAVRIHSVRGAVAEGVVGRA
jgi:threonylcarbamoyladenosine tRNA methylthiotransferase MtaB